MAARDGNHDDDFEFAEGGLRFRVVLSASRRWRTFRAGRRMYRVTFLPDAGGQPQLLLPLLANNAIERLLQTIMDRTVEAHLRAGRSTRSLITLTLIASGLDHPIMTSLEPIMSDDPILDLLEQLSMVLTSRQAVQLDGEFQLHVTIIDGPDPDPNLVNIAGGVSGWTKSSRFCVPMPDPLPPPFSDCCLLAALAYCDLRRLDSAEWRVVRRWGEKHPARRQRAAAVLHRHMSWLVAQHELDLEAFRHCALGKRFKREVAKLNIALFVFKDGAGTRPVFYFPERNDGSLPLVVVKIRRQKDGLWHAEACRDLASVSNIALRTTVLCEFCLKRYTRERIYQHKCRNQKYCLTCRQVIHAPHMYLDSLVAERRCVRENFGSLSCPRCRKRLFSVTCQKRHKKVCKTGIKFCSKCNMTHQKERHVCGERFCRTCRLTVPLFSGGRQHVCCMVSPAEQKFVQPLAFYDMETVCDPRTKEHVPNAVGLSFEDAERPGSFHEIYFYDDAMRHEHDGVLMKNAFFQCYWTEGQAPPQRRPTPKRLKGLGPGPTASGALDKFMRFILRPEFYDYVFLAHAGSKFDSLFILEALIGRNVDIEPLFDGNKALLLKVPLFRLRFIDSYKYVLAPLAQFPKRFPQMDTGSPVLHKGTFPFAFNAPENYEYCGPLPGREFFLDGFSRPGQIRAYEAYAEQWASRHWFFKEQIHRYLKQDVCLLRGGMLSFLREFYDFQRELQGEESGGLRFFHPLSAPFFTRSSFVHAVWRAFCMPPGQIRLVANQRNARQTSKYELEWLAFVSADSEEFIRTAFSHPEGQARLGNYYPDGLSEKTIYEFNGCLVHYHGGFEPDCPLSGMFSPADKSPFGEDFECARQRWEKKMLFYQSSGRRVVVKWECEYERERTSDEKLKRFIENYYRHGRPRDRLCLREGLRGGRTETFRMLFNQADLPDRRLYYIDKNSLYPTVAIAEAFPVGMPQIMVGEGLRGVALAADGRLRDANGVHLTGMVQATLLPPPSLFLPLLPVRIGGKLKFGLCATCLLEMRQTFCTHADAERAITGTWTTAELEYAASCGYRLVELWELFVYRERQPIFSSFYTRLARMKLESEGFPAALPPAERQSYVAKLNEAMPGLRLETARVARNEGRRQFAKDTSNAGLGKFSQSDLKARSVYVSSYEEMCKWAFDSPHLRLKTINPLSENLAEVNVEPRDELLGYHKNTQVVIYAFVTAYARISMMRDMREMMRLGCRLYYTDTDSIIFDYPAHRPLAALEERLNIGSSAYGAYKYETPSEIVSFASPGPKIYSLQTRCGSVLLKVKGFTLTNARAQSLLNIDSMREMLFAHLRGEKKTVVTDNFSIRSDKTTRKVKNTVVKKKYRNDLFDKRFIHDKNAAEVWTVPFGARHAAFADAVVSPETCNK